MTINPASLALAALIFLAGTSLQAADSNKSKTPQNASGVMTEMRVRQLNKNLQLTDEQQKKVRALIALEVDKIAKVDESGLELTARTEKVTAIKKETQAAIRPILTPEQMAKFDAEIQQAEKRKRRS